MNIKQKLWLKITPKFIHKDNETTQNNEPKDKIISIPFLILCLCLFYIKEKRSIFNKYKIVNNSSHSFDIKQTDVHSDVVEAISKSNAIVKVGNDYKVLKNDSTYFDLDQCYIPYMTKCSYFNNYITWLKNSGATTQTSAVGIPPA